MGSIDVDLIVRTFAAEENLSLESTYILIGQAVVYFGSGLFVVGGGDPDRLAELIRVRALAFRRRHGTPTEDSARDASEEDVSEEDVSEEDASEEEDDDG